MKKTLLLLAAACVAAVSAAQNGAYMEYKLSSSRGATGSVKVKFSEHGTLSDFNMLIPQMPGGGMAFKSLMQESSPDVVYSIDDKNKSYSETKKSEAPEDNKTYTVKKLGQEKVNGYDCVHALVTEGKETHEVWNTKDIAGYDKYAASLKHTRSMGSAKRDQALKDAGCDGIPVKFVHKGNEREGDMTVELVKFEKKSYGKAEFELPAGYTKGSGSSPAGMKSQQEIMSMTPEERAKYVEEMKKKYGK